MYRKKKNGKKKKKKKTCVGRYLILWSCIICSQLYLFSGCVQQFGRELVHYTSEANWFISEQELCCPCYSSIHCVKYNQLCNLWWNIWDFYL